MDDLSVFKGWPKTPRIGKLYMVVTEKLDGTNAQVVIDGDTVRAASRNRWLSTESKVSDNHGFARWVEENAEELKKLGRGRHYGEWWGQGIARNYGQDRKRFSLFNTSLPKETLPACVEQVPVLYSGKLDLGLLEDVCDSLRTGGSVAAPGFMQPEGVCIYLPIADAILKHPFDKSVPATEEMEAA